MAVDANSYGTAAGVALLVPMHTDSNGDFTVSTTPKLSTVESWIDELSAAINFELDRFDFDIPATSYMASWLKTFVQAEVAAQIRATYALTRRGPSDDEQSELKARELLTNVGKVAAMLSAGNQINRTTLKYNDPFSIDTDTDNEWSRVN